MHTAMAPVKTSRDSNGPLECLEKSVVPIVKIFLRAVCYLYHADV